LTLRQLSVAFDNSVAPPHIAVMTKPNVTIWFDGTCPLCVAEISLIRRLDAKNGRIAFVDLTGDGACPLDRGDMLAKFHAQETGKPIISGAAAFGAMWRQVTPFQPLGWLTLFPPALWAMNLLYVQFLRIRPRLQTWMRSRQPAS
jgi:predicted DCC family thiol-disulfide oxidoreductase YuxK